MSQFKTSLLVYLDLEIEDEIKECNDVLAEYSDAYNVNIDIVTTPQGLQAVIDREELTFDTCLMVTEKPAQEMANTELFERLQDSSDSSSIISPDTASDKLTYAGMLWHFLYGDDSQEPELNPKMPKNYIKPL